MFSFMFKKMYEKKGMLQILASISCFRVYHFYMFKIIFMFCVKGQPLLCYIFKAYYSVTLWLFEVTSKK